MNLYKKLTNARYNIGFIGQDETNGIINRVSNDNQVSWLDWNDYKGGWFADPFIFAVDETTLQVLVEEWVEAQNKGRISKLIIDRISNKLQKVVPLLEKTTHLSFPNIWRENGQVYVYPENSQSGGLYLYEYDVENESLINPYCLINEPLLDAQLIKYQGNYFLMAVRQDNGIQQNSILYVYKSSCLKGNYSLIQILENKKKEERGAGAIFWDGNHIIRPAQSCEVDYGYSMVFYELVYSNNHFEEKEIGRIYPNSRQRWNRKIHTFNKMEGMVVVDGYEYKYRLLSYIYRKTLKKLL